VQITVWKRYNPKKEAWEHNHTSYGWSEDVIPVPKSKLQVKPWKNATWKKKHTYLVNGEIT